MLLAYFRFARANTAIDALSSVMPSSGVVPLTRSSSASATFVVAFLSPPLSSVVVVKKEVKPSDEEGLVLLPLSATGTFSPLTLLSSNVVVGAVGYGT